MKAGRMTKKTWMRGAVSAAVVLAGLLPAPPGSTAVGQVRSGDNYRLGADPQPARGKQAPGLAVNPTNPNHVVEVHLDLLASECQFNTSTDGGVTWSGGNLEAPAPFPSNGPCSVVGHGATGMDGSVAFGAQNPVTGERSVYVAWGSPPPGFGNSALVSKSVDGGRTFSVATVALVSGPSPGGAGPGPNYAFPKLAVVPAGGNAGADRIVMAAANTFFDPSHGASGSVVVATSDDGGATWSVPEAANAATTSGIEHTQPAVGDGGAIYVGWRTNTRQGFIQVGKSTDGGRTWTQSNATTVRGAPPGFCCSSFPRLAVDAGEAATGVADHVYVVWNQDASIPPAGLYAAQDHFMNTDADVWFIRSTDAGASWNGRRQLNDPPVAGELTQTRHPNVSVAPDGRVDVVWHDRRHSYRACANTHGACKEARLGDTYLAHSSDRGATFSANRRVTDRTMSNDVGYDYRFGTYWDYGPVSASLGSDRVLVAWMDSREGNVDTDTQDIYLAKVDLAAAGPVPVTSVGKASPSGLSVALSRRTYPGGGEGLLASTFATRPATKIVIASNDSADALVGGVLARAHVGPLLLSPGAGLPEHVKAEVRRMDPIGAFVIGDAEQLSPQVVSDLVAAGVPADQIVRFEGTDAKRASKRAQVAAGVARSLDRRSATEKTAGTPAFDAVVVANPESPDAAAAAALAVNRRLPFLYVEAGSIPQVTKDALAALNITKTLVVGGADDVGAAVEAELAAAGRNPSRLGGVDQYATSRAVVAESIARGLPSNQVFVATGDRALHGAVVGAAAGRIGGLLLLTPEGSSSAAVATLDGLGLTPRLDRIVTSEMPGLG